MATQAAQMIQGVLEERTKQNPRYSLRSFARECGVSHTVLSLVLNGKRRLSHQALEKISAHLKWDAKVRNALIRERAGLSAEAVVDYQQLDLDRFTVISDWYHYGILSALELPNARHETAWFAQQLGISETQVTTALQRLERLELIKKNSQGEWKRTGPFVVRNKHSTEATRNFHKQLLQKAMESMTAPFETRELSSTTMAIDPELMPYARERIAAFRTELAEDLEKRGNKKSVYHLSVQFFPLTKEISS